ncbi:MAG: OB-fold domain-containing protein [Acidobacteria bacterium]|nr:OB-fold domain-containing protein [Acidobacteriota bacterium]
MSDRNAVDTPVLPKITPSSIDVVGDAWVVELPRFGDEGTHFHTYGLLTPYFKGLAEGRLMATRCVFERCPIGKGNGELWLPPRADCPDCHQPMVWQQIRDPHGYVYSYTLVERGGAGLEIPTPYYQIDVKIAGVCSIVKSYLVGEMTPLRIGDRVRAAFRTGRSATHTALDLYFERE